MRYLIKIDFTKLNKQDEFLILFNSEKFKKYIISKGKNSVVIAIPLFDFLQYELESNKKFKKSLRFTLLKQNMETSKVKIILDKFSMKNEKYDAMLRIIRY